MMEQINAVEKALAALRAVCVAEPETPRTVGHNGTASYPAPAQPTEVSPSAWWTGTQWTSVFPHCPRCASYALYRKDNIGAYECLTCGLEGIEESAARRLV